MSLFGPVRVLDVAGDFGGLPGMILAQMGADVVRIEPPGGEQARQHAPCHAGQSLPWTAFNLSKRSLTLDLSDPRGRDLFLRLVDGADVVLESFRPGRMAGLGLAPAHLIARRPSLVVTSLTAFGQTGPYAGNAAADVTIMALSGLMAVTGFPGLPPLRLSHDQTVGLGALQAALGTLVALHARVATGQGQHVDVSALDAARLANYREPLRWEFEQAVEVRRGNVARRGRGGFVATIWRCADGWITWSAGDDPRRARSLFEAAAALGIATGWQDHDFAALPPQDMPQEQIDRLEADIAPFFERHTRDELEAMARQKGWILVGLLDMAEATAQPQVAAREFLTRVPFAGSEVTVPAFPFRTSEAQPATRGPAPGTGADTEAVLSELGLSPAEVAELRRTGVA